MTVSSQTSYISYAGNGAQVAFSVPFYFLANSDLVVTLRSSVGVDTIKTITTHYTVAGAGVLAGGTVTMLTAPALNETLIIERDPPITQTTDYDSQGVFPAESHERALDKVTMVAQALRRDIDRAMIVAVGEVPVNPIPAIAFRSGNVLEFDGDGQPVAERPLVAAVADTVSVGSIAALRALTIATVTSIALVSGYHAGSTRGGGAFKYDAADTTTADDAGMVIVDAASRRWKRIIGPFNGIPVEWYGAKADNLTDSTTAIQSAVTYVATLDTAAQTGGTVLLGFGRYVISSSIKVWNHNGVFVRGMGRRSSIISLTEQTDGFYWNGYHGIATGSVTAGGTGYVNGTYLNVPLTGGTGNGATANITVSGGAVTAVTIVIKGADYTDADVLSASAANLGGTGSGFTWTVSTTSNVGSFGGLSDFAIWKTGADHTNLKAGFRSKNFSGLVVSGMEFRGLDIGWAYDSSSRSYALNNVWSFSGRTTPATACYYVIRTGENAGGGLHIDNDDMGAGSSFAEALTGSITAAGSSYTNGTYTGVSLTGGTGTWAKATITVSGTVVTGVTITSMGFGYTVGDVLSANAADIGGTGSGFTWTAATVSTWSVNHVVYVKSVEGIYIDNCHYVGYLHGITCEPTANDLDEIANIHVSNTYWDGHIGHALNIIGARSGGSTFYRDIWLIGCQLRTGQYGINISPTAGTVPEQIHVIGGSIARTTRSAIFAADQSNAAKDVIVDRVTFRSCNEDDASEAYINVSGSGWMITRNRFTGAEPIAGDGYAVQLRSNATGCTVEGNDATEATLTEPYFVNNGGPTNTLRFNKPERSAGDLFRLVDPMRWHVFQDDFTKYSASDWTVTTVEAGSGNATEAVAGGLGGGLVLTNDDADNDADFLQWPVETFRYTVGKRMFGYFRLKVSDATQSDFIAGLQIGAAAALAPTDGMFFSKDDGDTNLDFQITKNSTTTKKNTIATVANDTFLEMLFFYPGTGSDMLLWATGGSWTTASLLNVPDDEDLAVSFGIQNGEAVAKSMSIDMLYIAQER